MMDKNSAFEAQVWGFVLAWQLGNVYVCFHIESPGDEHPNNIKMMQQVYTCFLLQGKTSEIDNLRISFIYLSVMLY